MTDDNSQHDNQTEFYERRSNENWKERFGWFYSPDSERVYNPRRGPAGPIIATEDGDIESWHIQGSLRRIDRGQETLWSRLGPVEIGDIEIKRYTELWHVERESWLRAETIDLVTEPTLQPKITFKEKNSHPLTHLTYSGERLLELRSEGIIESKAEVNKRAEEALEELRSNLAES